MDITFGSPEFAAGMLVRAVSACSGELVEGPCKVVDHLLSHCSCASIQSLVDAIGTELPSLCLYADDGTPRADALVYLTPWRPEGTPLPWAFHVIPQRCAIVSTAAHLLDPLEKMTVSVTEAFARRPGAAARVAQAT